MSAEQISELVLDLYEARPEAREYLDFYVKPDIDAKLQKAQSAIKKEINRSSRGRSKMRSTRLRRLIKDISSLNPGDEPVCDIMTFTITEVCALDSNIYIKETTRRALAKLLTETVIAADAAGMLDVYLPRLRSAVAGMSSSFFHRSELKSQLREALRDALDSL